MNSLKIYSVLDGYAGKISYEPPAKSQKKDFETIIIVDTSGSMSDVIGELTRALLTSLRNAGYKDDDIITVITFESRARGRKTSVGNMSSVIAKTMGGTHFVHALNLLEEYVKEIAADIPIRILTISDGEIADQDESVKKASELALLLANHTVCCKAVRYFTSRAEPETRGLASVLQFDSVGDSRLKDINPRTMRYEELIAAFSTLLEDGLGNSATLEAIPNDILKNLPWDINAQSAITVSRGEKVIWLTKIPESVTIDGETIKIENEGELTFEKWKEILDKIKSMIYRLKLLSIADNDQARNEFKNAKCFVEKWLESVNAASLKEENETTFPSLLNHRIEAIKKNFQRQLNTARNELAQCMNNNNISALNSAQQAKYLRSLDGNRQSKALARRAVKGGIDFEEILYKEIKMMRDFLKDLDGVDDSNHVRSFFSLATTLDGIRAICGIFEDEWAFSTLTTMEILQIINIVGIACAAPIGEYPDPQTWRINKIYPGFYISVSDLITAHQQSGETARLTLPQSSETITAVVPYFEDERLQRFLQIYAPNLLEYICSVGMRSIIANVPRTYLSTLGGGILKLLQDINENKFEVNIQIFCQLIKNYDTAQKGIFSDIVYQIFSQSIESEKQSIESEKYSLFLGNSGTSEMIGPMIIIAKKDRLRSPLLPRILRAIYSQEYYLGVRRFLKKNNTENIAALHTLLGIDIDKYGTTVGEPFTEDDPNPIFHSELSINEEYFKQIANYLSYVDGVALLPKLIKKAIKPNSNSIEKIKSLPKYGSNEIAAALNVDSLREFKLHTIIQAMFFDNQSKRYDADAKRMKILDFGIRTQAEAFVKGLAVQVYEDEYKRALKHKRAREEEIMAEELVKSLVNSPITEFKKHLENGIKRGNRIHKITCTNSSGFDALKDNLLAIRAEVPDRLEKIRIILTGKDENNSIIWNRGNVLFDYQEQFALTFYSMNATDMWIEISKMFKNAIHQYRSAGQNRHGHSNSKPSYWALGYPSIKMFFVSISQRERERYELEHIRCCGILSMKN